jgi:hypothetical protein
LGSTTKGFVVLFIVKKRMLIALFFVLMKFAMTKPEHVERDRERPLLCILGSGGDAGGTDAGSDLGDLLLVVDLEQAVQI